MKKAQDYHDQMAKIFKSASTNAEKNIKRHEENQEKIKTEDELTPEQEKELEEE